jgi:hypothetical protein
VIYSQQLGLLSCQWLSFFQIGDEYQFFQFDYLKKT